jgi:Staphylococcal nuclease homologue
MGRRFRRRLPTWLGLALLLAGVVAFRWWTTPAERSPVLQAGSYRVVAIFDHGTIGVGDENTPNPKVVSVRLLGIGQSTDEIAAHRWLETNVLNRSVRLEFDKRRRAADGAALAYVYLGDLFINAELIRNGSARYDAYPGDSTSHAKMLRQATEE